MKLARFVCLFILFAVPLLGQSNPVVRSPRSLASPEISFDPAVAYDSGGFSATSVAVADVNADGKPDLLVANYCATNGQCFDPGSVTVLLGNGDGTFKTAVAYSTVGIFTNAMAVGDVNGDGKPDLVVVNVCASNTDCDGSVGVLLGNGDGTFRPAVIFGSGGVYAQSVALADVNRDGNIDLLVSNKCDDGPCTTNGVVGVLLGNGDGTFQTAVTFGTGGFDGESITVADVDGDGKPDLLVANYCAASTCRTGSSGLMGVLLGNGDGTFQAAVTFATGGYNGSSVAVADVNGDGIPDLLVSNQCASGTCPNGSVGVLLGKGDGTFRPVVTYSSGGPTSRSVAVGDINGDGKPDLLVVNECSTTNTCSTVGVLLGLGDGTFQTVVTFGSGGEQAASVAVGDVNGDGKPDLLVSNLQGCSNCLDGSVGVLINTSLAGTNTSISSSRNPSGFGQSVIFAATVVAAQTEGTPTGSVDFFDGNTNLGHAALNSSGIAILSTSTLVVGTHSITARYNGDPNFGSSTSQVLSQVVQGAVAKLNPTSINFGNMTIGLQIKQAILVNLTNTGNTTLTISSVAITGTNSSDYFVENGCPTSLAAGFGCTMSVGFTPTALGTRTASVSITDNAANSPQTIPLTGVGVQPAVSLSSTSLTFPTQVVFTNSKAQTVTVTNNGVGILSITNIALSAPFTQTNTCGSNINPGSTCALTVTFRPTTAGSITGLLSLTDNAPDSPQTISVKGTGTYILFNPSTFNFGNQPLGTKSLPKKITLSNKGSVAVSISKISLTGANAADFAQTNTCGTSVAAGASCFITVTFTPSATGKRTANVSVMDNGGGSPQTVSLTGTGT